TKGINIIAQSGVTKIEQRHQGFSAGANDFVNKPIDEFELISRLTMVLEHHALYLRLLEEHEQVEKELNESAELLNALLPSKDELAKLEDTYDLSLDTY